MSPNKNSMATSKNVVDTFTVMDADNISNLINSSVHEPRSNTVLHVNGLSLSYNVTMEISESMVLTLARSTIRMGGYPYRRC